MKNHESAFAYLTVMLLLSVFFGVIAWNMTFLFSGLTGIGCILFMHVYYTSQIKNNQ